jgi:outer membrane protein TolC
MFVFPPYFNLLGLSLAVLLLTGCVSGEKKIRAATDFEVFAASAKELPRNKFSGRITVEEAVAHAIAHSSTLKAKQLEALQSRMNAGMLRADALPSLTASGDYYARDRAALSHSSLSNSFATSSENSMGSGDLKLAWNILDLGIASARSRAVSAKAEQLEEEARSIAYRTAADARQAFWNTAAFVHIREGIVKNESLIKDTIKRIDEGLDDNRIDSRQLLQDKQDLLQAKAEAENLSASVAPDLLELCSLLFCEDPSKLTLELGQLNGLDAKSRSDAGSDIDVALLHRPELRSVFLEARISAEQGRVAVLQMLPSLGGALALNGDSNKFLRNANWVSIAASTSFNLLNVFKIPRQVEMNATQSKINYERAIAAAKAITLQVLLSRQRQSEAMQRFTSARTSTDVQFRQLLLTRAEIASGKRGINSLATKQLQLVVSETRLLLAAGEVKLAEASYNDSLGRNLSDSYMGK